MSAKDWPDELHVTPEILWGFVEQPEPTTNGDAFMVNLEALKALGYTHVEIHFPTQGLASLFARPAPDHVTFYKVEIPE